MLKYLALAAVALVGLVAGVTVAGGTPPAGGPPGQGECQHGNSGKDCRPDPQPGHGKDCEEHGKHGGVNEDHCDGENPPPPVDVCKNLPGKQESVPSGYHADGDKCYPDEVPTTPTDTTPTPAPHGCEFVGADKDGGVDKYGGTNDDCAPRPDPPVTTTATPAAAPPATAAPPLTTTVVTSAGPVTKPAAKPKAKATAKPKPDKPPVVVKVTRKNHGVVVIKTSDGKTHTGIMGSG